MILLKTKNATKVISQMMNVWDNNNQNRLFCAAIGHAYFESYNPGQYSWNTSEITLRYNEFPLAPPP